MFIFPPLLTLYRRKCPAPSAGSCIVHTIQKHTQNKGNSVKVWRNLHTQFTNSLWYWGQPLDNSVHVYLYPSHSILMWSLLVTSAVFKFHFSIQIHRMWQKTPPALCSDVIMITYSSGVLLEITSSQVFLWFPGETSLSSDSPEGSRKQPRRPRLHMNLWLDILVNNNLIGKVRDKPMI